MEEHSDAETAATAQSPPPGCRPVSKLRRRLLVGSVVVVNLAFMVVLFYPPVGKDVLVALRPLFGRFLRVFLVGFFLSQGALAALWAALGGSRALWRDLAVVLGVIAAVWWTCRTGTYFRAYDAIELLCSVWGFLLVARLLGLGLVSTPDAPRTLRPLQFTIADMLLWTTAVAVISGLLRWLALDWSWLPMDWYVWMGISVLGLVAIAAMFLALGRGCPLLRVLLLPLSVVACAGSMEVLCFINQGQPLSTPELENVAIIPASMALWLAGSLWLIRLAGYRLAWQWRFGRDGEEVGGEN